MYLLIFKVYLFILRETETAQVGERHQKRERETETQGGSWLPVQSPTWGSNSQNCEIMTWDKTKSQMLNQLSPPRHPFISLDKTCVSVHNESVWVGEGQREGERIPSRLLAISAEPDSGLHPSNREIMT